MAQSQDDKILTTFNGLLEDCSPTQAQLVNRWVHQEYGATNLAVWFANAPIDKRLDLCSMMKKALVNEDFSAFGNGAAKGQAGAGTEEADEPPKKPAKNKEPEPEDDAGRVDPTEMHEEETAPPEPEPEEPKEEFPELDPKKVASAKARVRRKKKNDKTRAVDELESEARLLEAMNDTIRTIVADELEDFEPEGKVNEDELREIIRPVVAEEIDAYFKKKFGG